MRKNIVLVGLSLLLLVACGNENSNKSRGVYLLMDTSGTYTEELAQARNLVNAILVRLEPGDSFAVGRIDTASFSEKDIIYKVTLDERPSVTNQQKRQFGVAINEFIKDVKGSRFTDITGGILQGIEYLNEKDTGLKEILIYSDLKEELPKGYVRDSLELPLGGFHVVALNVTKLRSDNVDPREYIDRLTAWKERTEKNGGEWRVVNDMDRLENILVE